MPMLKRPDAEIYYEIHGAGFPLLLYAPGGLRSQVAMWGGASPNYPKGFPWMDPRTALAESYGETVRGRNPSISQEAIDSFGRNMFGSDFVFSVSRDFVKTCRTPLFLQPGTDKPHPAKTSAEIAELAPNIEIQKDWRGPEFLQQSIERVRTFLERHTPQ